VGKENADENTQENADENTQENADKQKNMVLSSSSSFRSYFFLFSSFPETVVNLLIFCLHQAQAQPQSKPKAKPQAKPKKLKIKKNE